MMVGRIHVPLFACGKPSPSPPAFSAFLPITLPHIAWGAPNLRHPDQMIKR